MRSLPRGALAHALAHLGVVDPALQQSLVLGTLQPPFATEAGAARAVDAAADVAGAGRADAIGLVGRGEMRHVLQRQLDAQPRAQVELDRHAAQVGARSQHRHVVGQAQRAAAEAQVEDPQRERHVGDRRVAHRAGGAAGAGAQDSFPSRPLTLVVPFEAGSDADSQARRFAQSLVVRKPSSWVTEALRAEDAWKGLIAGLEATQRELASVFERNGIKKIDALGQPLDPNRHQAMVEIPSAEAEPGTIVQEMQSGYMIRDRLLRPALVGVAKAS